MKENLKKQNFKNNSSLQDEKGINHAYEKELVFNFKPHRIWESQKILDFDKELFGLGASGALLSSIPHSNCLFYFCNNFLLVSVVRFAKKDFNKSETEGESLYEHLSRLSNPEDFLYEIGIDIASDKLNFDFCTKRFSSFKDLEKEIKKIKEKEFFFGQCLKELLERKEISSKCISEIKSSDLLRTILMDLILKNWADSSKEFNVNDLKYLSNHLSKLDWTSEEQRYQMVIESIESREDFFNKEVVSEFFEDVCGTKYLSELKRNVNSTDANVGRSENTDFWNDFLKYQLAREEAGFLNENLNESQKNAHLIEKKSKHRML